MKSRSPQNTNAGAAAVDQGLTLLSDPLDDLTMCDQVDAGEENFDWVGDVMQNIQHSVSEMVRVVSLWVWK